jgi:hypothetical protein
MSALGRRWPFEQLGCRVGTYERIGVIILRPIAANSTSIAMRPISALENKAALARSTSNAPNA